MTIKLRDLFVALPLLILGWLAVLALVMRLDGTASAALVLGPPDGLVAALPGSVAVTGRNALGVIVRGDPDLVAALYEAGAWLVLPVGLSGCLVL
jgi:hypothetical protein